VLRLVGFLGDDADLCDKFCTRPRTSRGSVIGGLTRRRLGQLSRDAACRRVARQRSNELQDTNSKAPGTLRKIVSLRHHARRTAAQPLPVRNHYDRRVM
jgi:hypothetical protein